MSVTPEFRDVDGTILQYGDVVVIVETWDAMDGRLVKGKVTSIADDCVKIYDLVSHVTRSAFSSEQIMYLYTE